MLTCQQKEVRARLVYVVTADRLALWEAKLIPSLECKDYSSESNQLTDSGIFLNCLWADLFLQVNHWNILFSQIISSSTKSKPVLTMPGCLSLTRDTVWINHLSLGQWGGGAEPSVLDRGISPTYCCVIILANSELCSFDTSFVPTIEYISSGLVFLEPAPQAQVSRIEPFAFSHIVCFSSWFLKPWFNLTLPGQEAFRSIY